MTDLDLDALCSCGHSERQHETREYRGDKARACLVCHVKGCAKFRKADDLDALERLPRLVKALRQQAHSTRQTLREPLFDEAADAIDALLARLRAAEQARDETEQLRTQDHEELYTAIGSLPAILVHINGERSVAQCVELSIENLDRERHAAVKAKLQAEAERDALQARVTELEAQPPQPDLAVDLAAFLNLTGEAVADALLAAGCRLEVVRDPSAPEAVR